MGKQTSLQQTDFGFSELNRGGGIAGSQGSLHLPFNHLPSGVCDYYDVISLSLLCKASLSSL